MVPIIHLKYWNMTITKFYCSPSKITRPLLISLFSVSILLAITLPAIGQSCDCSIRDVQNNSVTPCETTIGEVVTVATESELKSAISLANSNGGDMTILIEDGIYQVASTSSFPYITGNNIVFRSASGNRDAVVIRGGGMVPTNSTEDGFLIAGDNVTIADLTIREVGNHGIQVSGHNLYVHNVRIQNTYEQMLKGSTAESRIDSAVIQCSLFEYTSGIGPNWYIGGLDIHKGHGWLVRDNMFKNIISPGQAISEHAIHFWDQSSHNTVERNWIINCDRGIGFGLGQNGDQNDGGMIRNNMIYNNGSGQYNDVGIGLESSPNTLVYNNTVYVQYPNAIEYRFQTTTNVEIKNNLTNKAITSRNGGTALLGTNETNAMDDWFEDLPNGDLHLVGIFDQLVDQGEDLGTYVSDDFNQIERPQGFGIDIGAQEFLMTNTSDQQLNSNYILAPNPAGLFTHLHSELNLINAKIDIINTSGQVIRQTKNANGTKVSLDLSEIPDGLYFVRLNNNNHYTTTFKLVIVP